MTGLIYKEFCTMKGQLRAWSFALLILSVYGIVLKSAGFIYMMTSLIGIMSTLTLFTYDKMYRCDEFIAAMPVTRRKVVLSKYVFLLLLDIAVAVAAAVVSVILSLFLGQHESAADMAMALISVFGTTIFLQAILLPLIYRMGAEKARIILMLLAVSPFLIITFLKERLAHIDLGSLMGVAKTLPIILVAVVVISYYISVFIYKKKDL